MKGLFYTLCFVVVLFFALVVAERVRNRADEEIFDTSEEYPSSGYPFLTTDVSTCFVESQGGSVQVPFDVNVAWWTSVIYENGSSGWLSLSPWRGKAGNVVLNVVAAKNDGIRRKARIKVAYGPRDLCGKRLSDEFTIIQQGVPGKTDITAAFSPLFARELARRGYIGSADRVSLEEVENITTVDIAIYDVWDFDRQQFVPNGEPVNSLEGIEYFASLTKLHCDNNGLRSLDVSKNIALEALFCSDNSLTSLDVSCNPALKGLDCSSNRLTSLDVSSNMALEDLSCGHNSLTSLDVSRNPALKRLSCGSNRLVAIKGVDRTNLEHFRCYDNRLESLDVSDCGALKELICEKNRLTSLDVSCNKALKALYCADNRLKTLDVSANAALLDLLCGRNSLTSLDVSRNPALKTLYCDSNRLSSLDISANIALDNLKCVGNPGDGKNFPVAAWFDNDNVPPRWLVFGFTTGSWEYDGHTVTVNYTKVQ